MPDDDFTDDELRSGLDTAAAAARELDQWIVRAYRRLPVTEIAQRAGLTRQSIYYRLEQMGVRRSGD